MPAEGRELAVEPSTEERAAVAAQLGITAVDRLKARLKVVKFRGGLRVTGQLEAEITQPSVVSLEPVSQVIDEPIDRVFLPAGSAEAAAPAPHAGVEVFVDLEGDDPPDHFSGPEVDLSDLVIEALALAVDPYPRAEGESLETLGISSVDADRESPFAALKALKDKGDKGL